MNYLPKILCLVLLHTLLNGFQNLSDFSAYAKEIIEYPEADNSDWNDPIFSSYYATINPGRMHRFFASLGLIKLSFNPEELKKELTKIVELYERKNLSGRQVIKLILDKPSRAYVFGDIQGHFHSLVRSIDFLHKEGIVDNNFKLISPDDYLIFNGDFVDRSAYSLECLYLVVLLLKHNPEQVFYVRGKHEDKDYWQNFGLKRELMQRAHYLLPHGAPLDEIPLGDIVRRFFDTLPLALYIAEKSNPLDLIRISHAGRDNRELKEYLFDTFFENNLEQKTSSYDIRLKVKSKTIPNVKALITTENWLKEHRARGGLGLLDQELGTTSWSIVSTPILAYQKYYNFHYDAFVELRIAQPIEESTITLWNNNIKTSEGFTEQESYFLTTSMPYSKTNLTKASLPDIKIGATMPLNRGIAIMGQRIKRGMDIRINEENIKGGINGQHISTIVYNDDYTPFMAKQNVERLIENNNTRIILLTVGSQIFEALIDFVKNNEITAIFPTNGSPAFRKEELTSLVNFGPSYEDEVEILMEHLFSEYGARKFLFFYQNDAYGIGLLNEAHKQLKAHGITDWIDVPYTRGETNFKKQVGMIKNAQIDTIGLFSTAGSTEELIRQLGIDALTNKKIFGVSYLGEITFREFIKAHGLQVILGAVVPNPARSNLEAAAVYRKAMDANNLPYDVFSFQSFFATSLLIDVLHRIKGQITREKIIEKLEALYDDKFQGFTLTFNPKTRSIARYVWIETGENEDWIERKIKNTLN